MLVVSIYRRRFVVSSFPCPIVVLLLAVISFLAVLSFAGGHSILLLFLVLVLSGFWGLVMLALFWYLEVEVVGGSVCLGLGVLPCIFPWSNRFELGWVFGGCLVWGCVMLEVLCFGVVGGVSLVAAGDGRCSHG